MDIDAFSRREKMLKLREELIAVEEARLSGDDGFEIAEVEKSLENILDEVNEINERTI